MDNGNHGITGVENGRKVIENPRPSQDKERRDEQHGIPWHGHGPVISSIACCTIWESPLGSIRQNGPGG